MKKENISKIKKLEQQIAELTAGWQRTQADFVNYKKQASEDRLKLIESANTDLIYSLLPVLDNFKLAANHAPKDLENNDWAMGIKQIERQLELILESEGLTKISALGEHFNPELHEAVEEVDSDKEEGTIAAEILPGYKFNGQVLRPAKVKVAK
jgi:molecular chaperone GrpE